MNEILSQIINIKFKLKINRLIITLKLITTGEPARNHYLRYHQN